MAIAATRFGYRWGSATFRNRGGAFRTEASWSVSQYWAGRAYLAGEAPKTSDPQEPDGRFRILNRPAQGRVVVLERGSGVCVASVLSKPDGTWRVDRLSADYRYTVIGFDDSGGQNAAIQDWIAPATEADT